MPYTKTYRTVLPIEPEHDVEQARWLTRESFERKAAQHGLVIVDYRERTLTLDEIPPKAAEHLPRPLTDYSFVEFVGTARVNEVLLQWVTAESQHLHAQGVAWQGQ
uniref:Minor tail protein n=1 Tax=Mycobacterium phage Pharb TaxID=3136626 RepID=A0AAU8GQ61_9VIRU